MEDPAEPYNPSDGGATLDEDSMRRNVVIGVAIVAALLVWGAVRAHSRDHGLQAWCRTVHVGDAFGSIALPKNGLLSVSGGTWTYDGGVSVSFVDGQVAAKTCG